MTERSLQVLIFITIFYINTIKSDDTINALKKILNELNAPTADRHWGKYPKQLYHPHNYKHGKSKHISDSPNLMNIQTMNLFLKPNKRQREESQVNRMLRTDADTCDATGRCGCTGPRCGNSREDDLADEVDRVVNEISKQLTRDENIKDNTDGEQRERDRAEGDGRNSDRDEYHQQRNKDGADIDLVKQKNRYNDGGEAGYYEINNDRNYDDDDLEKDLGEKKTSYYNDDLLKNKRIKVNDNLDVVILDKSDLEILLRNQDFVDLTRNDHKDDEDRVLADYNKFTGYERKSVEPHRSTDDIKPEDFFGLYEPIKNQVIKKVSNYVKNKNPSTSLNIKHLTPNHKKKLRNLKMKYRRGEVSKGALDDEIVKIIFNEEKVVPHDKKNQHIFVPKWIYNKALSMSSKETLNQNLRSQKRILPLTFQQKERLYNKEKGKPIQKLVWRKNSDHRAQRFGIPFDLEVHGLGQLAP
ncbi:jg21781 [Pararge aegeria aegeria]|uniref:Jg21781 protein n=1 Tax=Pararge aegeria aegeria TaxID=348720 RepID=A0A8S4R6N5_9NEOP|nr:jg21781 [Pararge aegeria aegeria]